MRNPRFFLKNEELVYHIISRTALPGFVLTHNEKVFILKLITQLSKVYFFDILAFCIMGNHFHLMVRNRLEKNFSDEEILNRLYNYYPKFRKDPDHWRSIFKTELPFWRDKLSNLSEFIKDLKQRFSRKYNKDNNRKGYFWGDRFKSVLLENGKAVRACMAYIDLNPIRANIVKKPEDYEWSSIFYRTRWKDQFNLLSDDLYKTFSYYGKDIGFFKSSTPNKPEVLKFYLKYIYEIGLQPSKKGKTIDKVTAKKALAEFDNLFYRVKAFSQGSVIGSQKFIKKCYGKFRDRIKDKRDRKPNNIIENQDLFSLIKVRK